MKDVIVGARTGGRKCAACRSLLQKVYRAVGLYGWSDASGKHLKADLCADHAAMLRAKTGVVVLTSYRKRDAR